jgi:hypothetical protein
MLTTHAIVIADGPGDRWGNYLGAPKHFAPVDGEPILNRTVRLFSTGAEVTVVGPADDERYRIPGSTLFTPRHVPEHGDADKFLNNMELWNPTSRTLVLYGDCYFTEAAAQTILSSWVIREWTLFCRFGPSRYSGCQWGECFAQSFYPEHWAEHLSALWRIMRLYQSGSGALNRCGGWEHYRAMLGWPNEKLGDNHVITRKNRRRAVEIKDWTEDFDFPADYDEFMRRRGH